MGLRQRFGREERSTSFEGIALSVAIIAVAFVASADMLDYLTRSRHELPSQVAAVPHGRIPTMVAPAKDATIDYTPTASLPAKISRTMLDPCTGAPR